MSKEVLTRLEWILGGDQRDMLQQYCLHTQTCMGRREANKQTEDGRQPDTSTDALKRHDSVWKNQTDKEIVLRQETATVNTDRRRQKWSTSSRYCKWKSGWRAY